MNKTLALLCLVSSAVLIGVCGSVSPLPAATPPTTYDGTVNPTLQLQNAVRRLNLWLADSSDAEVWRRNLLLNLLDTQSALGERADLAVLAQIESRFSGSNEGLDKAVFRDVRDALKAQIQQLSEMHLSGLANLHDFQMAIEMAKNQSRPITIAMLDQQRLRAVYDLESLMKHYRKTMRSRKRANLFYDMQLDQTIDFLKGLEFEMPPEISVGKMDSMISSVKEQLGDIEEQIDAIPETPEPDDDPEEDDEDEQENQFYPRPFGPGPDSGGPNLQELKRSKKTVEAQLEMLRDQRSEVLKRDKPRRTKRAKEFRKLREFELNFAAVSKTQTDPYFIAVQTSLEQFVRSYLYGSDDNLQEQFLRKLQDLEENLVKIRSNDSSDAREAAGKLGESIGWLENANQLSPLVAAIRAKYSLPNFYFSVSGGLIKQFTSQTLSQTDPVRQNFNGRLIRGNSRVDGRVDLSLRDDPNQINVGINLSGTVAASTYVQQGKLQVFASSAGSFSAQRSLFANIGGLFASEPKFNVDVEGSYGGTTSKWRFVNRLAAKQFAESKDEADEKTASQIREQLGPQFSEQTDEAIGAGKEAIGKAQGAIGSNANLAPEMYLRSTATQIVLIGKKSTPTALAAQSYPTRSAVPTDIGVRIHESVFSNLFERAFSGKTFSNEELAERMGGMLGGDGPAALGSTASKKKDKDGEDDDEEEEDESFSITFSTTRPIQFEFENGTFGVAISGRRFLQGNKKINTGLKIGLRFKITRVDGKLKLVRSGKAELDYVGKKNAAAVAFRSFLNGKLNPEKGSEEISIDLPDNLLPIDQLEGLKDNELARRLTLIQCRSEDGWLYLGWNYTPENLMVQHLVDMPAIWTEAVVSTLNDMYIESSSEAEVPIAGPVNGSIHSVIASPDAAVEVPVGLPILSAPIVLPAVVPGELRR